MTRQQTSKRAPIRAAAHAAATSALAVLSLFAGAALADEPLAREQEALAAAELPAQARDAVLAALGAAHAIPDQALGSESAMARIEMGPVVINDQDVDGVVQGNVATGNTTGNNSIADSAFAGAAGFATAIQNTGNNVLIQNSTIVNVTLEP